MTSTTQPSVAATVVRAGTTAGAVAAVANAIIFLLGRLAGVPFEVEMSGGRQELNVLQPLFSSFVVILLGSALLGVMTRLRHGVGAWLVIAGVFLVLYGLFAFLAAEQTSTAVLLNVMHIVAFVIALVWLLPAARAGSRTPR